MIHRLGLGLVVVASMVACSASGSQDRAADVDAAATGGDDAGSAPTTYDSGPPATVGDLPDTGAAAQQDAGSDSAVTPSSCKGLADCSALGSKTGVTGVACSNSKCLITCAAEAYDVNGAAADGCEVPDQCGAQAGTTHCASGGGSDPVDNHTPGLAADMGSFSCDDTASQQHITGVIPSDDAPHNPLTDAFDTPTGSAPDYYKILGTGGALCQDDANLELQMKAPTAQMSCYELHLLTTKNNGGQTCTTDLTGHCSITNGKGSYGDNTTLQVWVAKTASCLAAKTADDAPYEITGHL